MHRRYAGIIEELLSLSKWLKLYFTIPKGKGRGEGTIHFTSIEQTFGGSGQMAHRAIGEGHLIYSEHVLLGKCVLIN